MRAKYSTGVRRFSYFNQDGAVYVATMVGGRLGTRGVSFVHGHCYAMFDENSQKLVRLNNPLGKNYFMEDVGIKPGGTALTNHEPPVDVPIEALADLMHGISYSGAKPV